MESTKTILAMLGLVFIGFVAGFFLQRHLTVQHFERVKNMGTSQGLKQELFDVIQATDEQQVALKPIIQQFTADFKDINQNFRNERTVLIDSLKKEMASEINPEQQKQLEHFTRRLRKPFRKKRYKNSKSRKKTKKGLSKE